MINRNILFFFIGILIFVNVYTQFALLNHISKDNDQVFRVHSINGSFTFDKPNNIDKYSFKININGAYVSEYIRSFCTDRCRIPQILGGEQIFTILSGRNIVYSKRFVTQFNKFYCTGNDWQHRICRFKDICFQGVNMSILTPYKIHTEKPFMILGARNPPYDRKRDRQYGIISLHRKEFPPNATTYLETTLYTSPYYNSGMLWHSLFDFGLPLFHTLQKFNLTKQRIPVIIPNWSEKASNQIFDAFTEGQRMVKSDQCYRDLIVGITKVKDETGKVYSFPKNFTKDLIDLVYERFKLNRTQPAKPVVLIVSRKSKNRQLVNTEELWAKLNETFPSYDFQNVRFEELSMLQQFEMTSKAAAMVGIHGSGLAHVAWMKSNSSLVEIFPYKFDQCRDWYERASVVSGARYYKYAVRKTSEVFNATAKTKKCWKDSKFCEGKCFDIMRDQNTIIDINAFIDLMKKVLK